MSSTLESLWPQFRVDVVPPVTILRVQAEYLNQATAGIVRGEVDTVTGDGMVRHRFDVVAPAANGKRVRILEATHEETFVYPVEVTWPMERDDGLWDFSRASTQDALEGVLKQILGSARIVGTIHSLLALSNGSVTERAA